MSSNNPMYLLLFYKLFLYTRIKMEHFYCAFSFSSGITGTCIYHTLLNNFRQRENMYCTLECIRVLRRHNMNWKSQMQ
jgi:hypothetical protein